MAEFQEVLRQWKRMCTSCLCSECILDRTLCISDPDSLTKDEAARIERTILDWAAANPEPRYPTWEEWLKEVGVMDVPDWPTLDKLMCHGVPIRTLPTLKVYEPIPADIAGKLGIKPKEDNDG